MRRATLARRRSTWHPGFMRWTGLFVGFVLLMASSSARADDVDVELVAKVVVGKDVPALVLKVNRSVAVAKLVLRSDDGRDASSTARRLRAGATHAFKLDAKPGARRYEGVLHIEFADGGRGELPLAFETLVADPIRVTVPYERLDTAQRRLELQMSRAADHCDYEAFFDGGDVRSGSASYAGEAAGTWLPLSWSASAEDVVLKIRLTCHDTDGFSGGIELYPWWLEIPHDDVIFATGSSEIRAEEAPKLDAALKDIDTAARRYGAIVDVKLYVSGHTDTVGGAASNQELSRARAQAIARYFKRKGVRVPIFFVGHGEERQAVPTGDEVDEARNRRARYVLGVQPPEPAEWRGL